MLTVAKFGGSSLADEKGFAAVKDILRKDPARKGVVVSAPGRRHAGDPKVTDLLYLCHRLRQGGGDWETVFHRVETRFLAIAGFCGAEITDELDDLYAQVAQGVSEDYLASRGEYFSAKILAQYLEWKFIDAAQWLRFGKNGKVDTVRSYGALWQLADRPFVTPGFYGTAADGSIRTFSRGGSDITGALAAAALEADLYENWTDVPGILQADPRLIPQAKPVRHMTFGELSDLSKVGTQVLHEGAVKPVREAGIGLQIRSTWEPEDPGTLILPRLPEAACRPTVLSLASRRERALISVSGNLELRDTEPDFVTAMLDRQTAAVPSAQLEKALEMQSGTQVEAMDGMALVAVVFAREAARGAAAADLLAALKAENIPVEAILRPFGGHTLVLAVDDGLYEKAMWALWQVANVWDLQERSKASPV